MYRKNPSDAKSASGKAESGKTASSSSPIKEKGAGGSWTWFLVKFVLFGLTLTGAYVGYTVYRTRRRDRF
jgi:mannose-binding lectin 2